MGETFMPSPLVSLSVPIYHAVEVNFFEFILKLMPMAKERNIEIDFEYLANDSLITRARNTLISKYYMKAKKMPSLKYMLFLDSDGHMHPHVLLNMIEKAVAYDLDVVGALVPLKRFQDNIFQEPTPYIFDYEGKNIRHPKDNSLAKADAIGTACIMLSTKVVNDLVRDAKVKGEWYHETDHSNNDRHYNIFQTGIRKTEIRGRMTRFYMSEDWFLCYKLKELGYDMWVDLAMQVYHRGQHDYKFTTVKEHEMIEKCREYLMESGEINA
jgi:hypothetical protein